jgi:nucleoside-diphosphate-sugar epimerase
MKLMVTGAGGFLGAAVVRAALSQGLEVVATARRPDPARLPVEHPRLAVAVADMADADGFRRLLAAERPQAIVHSAWSGLTARDRASAAQVKDNLLPCCALVEAAGQAGVETFVGIGSQAEYGPVDGVTTEETLPQPTSVYGAAKLAACQLGRAIARQAGMRFAWLRLFAAYGPGDNPDWLIPSLIRQIRSGERPRLTAGTQKWDYLYIDDAAQAVLSVIANPAASGTFNLASGRPVAVRALVEAIRDLVAPERALQFGEVPFAPDQIMHMEGSVEKLRRETGWTPATPLIEGLRRTVEAAG